jgi:integrase
LPAEEAGERRFLTATEVADLADAIAPRLRAMVLVAAYGGLRFGELAALRRERIDLLRGRRVCVAETLIDINGRLTFGPTKTRNGRRTVPLPRSTCQDLSAHLERFVAPPAQALLFTGLGGQPLRRAGFRRNWWLPAVRSAGLGLRFHDLRHTYVSLLIRAGANVRRFSTWAGHSSVAFTLDRYGHLYDDADDSVSERLDALLAGSAAPRSAQLLALRH